MKIKFKIGNMVKVNINKIIEKYGQPHGGVYEYITRNKLHKNCNRIIEIHKYPNVYRFILENDHLKLAFTDDELIPQSKIIINENIFTI